jgi:PAS domain S-box-containing protein
MFRNLKIWIQFVISFSIILVFMITIIMIGINQQQVGREKLTQIVKVNNVRIQLANRLINNARRTALTVREILLIKYQKQSNEEIQKGLDQLELIRTMYRRSADSLRALFPVEDSTGLRMLAEVSAHFDSATRNQNKVMEFVMADKVDEGTNFMLGKAFPSVNRWIKEVDELIVYNENYNATFYHQADEVERTSRNLMIIIGIGAVLLSMLVGFLLTRSITRPIRVATKLVVTRDLSLDLSDYQKGGGEFGLMIMSFSRDIAERIRLEEEMRKASGYARNLIEASLDPLVTISPEGKITDVNNTTVKATGVSREHLIGSDFANYFTDPDKATAGYKLVFSQGTVMDYPLTLRNSTGRTFDVMYNASVYKNEAGEVQGVFAAARDISETKRQEKELIAYRDQLEEMVKRRTSELSTLVAEVKDIINVLASSSAQILAATSQVATGTAETATAINETSTTVEEVQQAAKQSAQKAKNVADNAQRLLQVFQNGQKAVDETVNGMSRIREQMDSIAQTVVRLSEQSQSIGGIIASVTDIADQSNLLSVNAAIEAAKAGEHGKGFAVVAQEIKNLASQSKHATLQVRNILNDVQKATGAAVMATEQGSKAVESGVKQSLQAGEAIRILAESSNEAVQAATQIVASSHQQVVGMEQIGVAMQNINQAGTETAVSMVQAEKSAKSLHELGQKLKGLVDGFKG